MAWAALAPVIGAVAGNVLSGGQANNASNLYNQALAQYAGLEVPDIQEMMMNPELYASQGELNPYLEQTVGLGSSAFNDIMLDPTFQNSQLDALQAYEQLAQTGLSDADRAAFELARQEAATQGQATNNAVLQNMQQRGIAGSGLEMLAKLTNNQNSTQNLQKAQLEQAQAAQQARIAALGQQANLAGTMQNQAQSAANTKAAANDAISQFNAQNSQNVQARNVASKNQAQQANLTNAQNVANSNVAARNTAQQNNKNLVQQNFNNQMQLAGAKSGAYTGAGNQASQQAANTAGMWGTIGQGVGTILGSKK